MKYIVILFILILFLFTYPILSQTVSLMDGNTYTQDFNTLANTGTSSLMPNGWYFVESGTNADNTYGAGDGSSNIGNTYSFGAISGNDRALGTLSSSSLLSTIGAAFQNNTGETITEISIIYTGEQWRLGTLGRVDRLDFQLSTDASSLVTGTWSDVNQLDFITPVTTGSTGALDGNNSANRTTISHTVTGLNITDGSTFWIRWTDFNAYGSDDGLAVDDFSLTPTLSGTTEPLLAINPATLSGFSYITGTGPSDAQSYKLSGSNLDPSDGDITVTASTDYEVSTDNLNFSSDLNISYTAGSLTETDIYVRLKSGLAIGNYDNEIISNSGGGAVTKNVTVNGSVIPSASLSTSVNELNGFYYVFNSGPSISKSFTVDGTGLTPSSGSVTVDGSGSYEVSDDDVNFSGSININYTDGSFSSKTVYVRLKSALTSGNYNNEMITVSGGGANPISVAVNGVVAESPSFNNVVIAEIFGGGGNSGSPYKNDYIILYNPTGNAIDLSGWSVQYTTAGGTGSWLKTDLTGLIQANSYYAIQEYEGSVGSSQLPFTPDVTGTINLSATAGKVALVSNQTALSGSDPTGNPAVVDFVGYGSSANAFEGLGPAAAPSNTSSIRRKDNSGNKTYGVSGSGWDTNHNQFDFYVETDIQNSAPLPVELSSFYGRVRGKIVKLFWRTETEVNNFGFEIERRSSDGIWEKIGFAAGYGNSNSPKDYTFSDAGVSSGKYYYRLKQIDNDGSFIYHGKVEVDLGQIQQFELVQNFPNPFNPVTSIKFSIPEAAFVKLIVYNLVGQEVKTLINDVMDAGEHTVDFDGRDLNSGVYIYQFEAGDFRKVMKMTLVK